MLPTDAAAPAQHIPTTTWSSLRGAGAVLDMVFFEGIRGLPSVFAVSDLPARERGTHAAEWAARTP